MHFILLGILFFYFFERKPDDIIVREYIENIFCHFCGNVSVTRAGYVVFLIEEERVVNNERNFLFVFCYRSDFECTEIIYRLFILRESYNFYLLGSGSSRATYGDGYGRITFRYNIYAHLI